MFGNPGPAAAHGEDVKKEFLLWTVAINQRHVLGDAPGAYVLRLIKTVL